MTKTVVRVRVDRMVLPGGREAGAAQAREIAARIAAGAPALASRAPAVERRVAAAIGAALGARRPK